MFGKICKALLNSSMNFSNIISKCLSFFPVLIDPVQQANSRTPILLRKKKYTHFRVDLLVLIFFSIFSTYFTKLQYSCREEASCVWPVIDRSSSRSQDSFCAFYAGGVPIASSCQNRPISSKAYQMVINILINTTIDVLNVLNILDR